MCSLIVTAKLNNVDPRAWLADVLRRIADHPASRLHELLPWNWAREWERTVKVERVTDALPNLAYPVLIDAVGRCPPEDVGGPWGYGAFLDALANPAHKSHPETKEWIGEDFDPKALNAERLADVAAALAKTWARTPAKQTINLSRSPRRMDTQQADASPDPASDPVSAAKLPAFIRQAMRRRPGRRRLPGMRSALSGVAQSARMIPRHTTAVRTCIVPPQAVLANPALPSLPRTRHSRSSVRHSPSPAR